LDTFAPETCHEHLLDAAPLALAFDHQKHSTSNEFSAWKKSVAVKLREILGDTPERVPLNIRVESETDFPEFTERRFVYASEAFADVPCHLLVPKRGTAPFPVMICLQGHSTGMHISLGRPKYEGDEKSINGGDRDFALRAVKEGFAALVMEQRCFGERKDQKHEGTTCHHPSMVSLLLGRTMIGERVWDVSRAIDALTTFPGIDVDKIGCMGNSGGGTITYFAACCEPRIKAAMPSCYVCTFRDSIGRLYHCQDNYIPGILKWFEMGDLGCLISPRPLVVVAGRDDSIFPISGVEQTYDLIKRIYAAEGASDNCTLVVGEGGHRFYADDAWPQFKRLTQW
jgi:dienelactone hydrolase